MLAEGRVLLFAVLFGLGLQGCARHAQENAAAVGPPVPVVIETFAAAATSHGVVLPARVKATEEVTLVARAAGRLTAVPAREGARVRQGEPLARFDAPEMREGLEAARAEHEAATLSAAVAARQHARVESLYVARVVSASDRENSESADRNAQSRLARARANLEMLNAASVLRAPFDGVVVRWHRDPGADLAAGEPVVDLRSNAGIEIVVPIPEGLVPDLEQGRIEVAFEDGTWHPARLARFDGMTDFTSRTRTAHLVPAGPARLAPGNYTRVRIGTTAPAGGASAAIPASSIVRRGALTGVYVVQEGHARLRWVRLGRSQGEREEVLSGLFPGDSVVVTPDALRDGSWVRISS